MANSTNLLVNVSVLEATKNSDVLKAIATNLLSAENSAFKVAVRTAWLVGVSIPCGSGTITNKNAKKPKEVYQSINKSKATLSRWMKALRCIIDNNLFDDFNKGVYPFSFDKIIMIFEHELTADNTFADLMKMSVVEIEELYKVDDVEEESATDETAEEGDSEETATVDDSPIVKFTYNGTEYAVHESALIEFIENSCTIA